MKFFLILPVFSLPERSSAYLYDVRDIPEPSRQLYFLYTKLQNQLPKNCDSSTVFSPLQEIHVEEALMNGTLISSQEHSYLTKMDIRNSDGSDLSSQLPLIYGNFYYRISGSTDRDISTLYHLLKHDKDNLSPKLYGKSNHLLCGNFVDILPHKKSEHLLKLQ